ncbi:amino acid ABC transporter permease [Helicobacter sp. 12S02634-8]|uniref:amino acid ABC transporter permease n=1 Tax=Helicobacter sp. 12S02634-8 TaxID=1476199 RepID=UPI000BA65D0B|nr:amino acid ABC transporter permease [Helicobacter sp. 12S02634-8]PAF47370.1 amino acid ABC transporter permease [Helicobacter sp. 12S02634-8]
MDGNSLFALWRWEDLFAHWHLFVDGFLMTIGVVILGLCLALCLGVIFGLLSTSSIGIFRAFARIYVEFFQNTPLVIQVFFLYNGLPILGVVLDVFTIGVLGVGLYHGAYVSEVIRTGITSIAKGQFEAAQAQGFTYAQKMAYIILPQTIKIILPPLTNQAVNLIKNTSVLSIIAGADLMYSADSYASNSLNYAPAYMLCGLLYFLLCFPLAKFARFYEDSLKSKELIR